MYCFSASEANERVFALARPSGIFGCARPQRGTSMYYMLYVSPLLLRRRSVFCRSDGPSITLASRALRGSRFRSRKRARVNLEIIPHSTGRSMREKRKRPYRRDNAADVEPPADKRIVSAPIPPSRPLSRRKKKTDAASTASRAENPS